MKKRELNVNDLANMIDSFVKETNGEFEPALFAQFLLDKGIQLPKPSMIGHQSCSCYEDCNDCPMSPICTLVKAPYAPDDEEGNLKSFFELLEEAKDDLGWLYEPLAELFEMSIKDWKEQKRFLSKVQKYEIN